MPDPRSPEDSEKIADVASLYDTDEVRPYTAPASLTPAPAPTPTPAVSDGYDLAADPFENVKDDEPPRPVALPTPVERPRSSRTKPKAKATPEPSSASSGDTSEFETENSTVDPVWTRSSEWLPDLIRVGVAGLATLFAVWLFWSWGWVAFLALVLGGAATVLLSYPIMVTLERPVRITPEQAVTDFYAAASHHFPHYRRMWLLLSSAARSAGPFPDFDDFRRHWEGQVKAWKAKVGAGKYTPLKFEVEDFTADKSTGKETSRASYTVRVFVRDKEDDGPIASFRMNHGLVKGPDRMWYLNRGAPEPKAS